MQFKIILSIVGLFLSGVIPAIAFDHSHVGLTEMLQKYVNDEGMVNYAKLKKERTALDVYLKSTAAVTRSDFSTWDSKQQIAFLVNVYNAETLQLIIDHYPLKSIKNIGGRFKSPWKQVSVNLFGETTTLDHVEHGILRKDYSEPRIHFALVCAAVSCPPLRTEAYVAGRLDQQLDDQGRAFFAQTEKNRIEGGTLYLSAIFDWFGEDFTAGGKTLNQYVNPWFDGRASGKRVKFTDYSWKLNSQ